MKVLQTWQVLHTEKAFENFQGICYKGLLSVETSNKFTELKMRNV